MEHNWIVAEEVHAYAAKYSDQESEALKALNDATQAEVRGAQMLSGALQGAILSMISQLVQPKFVLELGTYTGYSAICLAAGMQEGGAVHTIDIDGKLDPMRQQYWAKAGVADKIVQHIGPALSVIPNLEPIFDLVFLDADKGNYIAYFDMLMSILPIGAVIVADNVMFHGEVLKPVEEQGKNAKNIQAFNDYVNASTSVSKVMLPVRDGITIIKKIK